MHRSIDSINSLQTLANEVVNYVELPRGDVPRSMTYICVLSELQARVSFIGHCERELAVEPGGDARVDDC